jgi:hypothetical protein
LAENNTHSNSLCTKLPPLGRCLHLAATTQRHIIIVILGRGQHTQQQLMHKTASTWPLHPLGCYYSVPYLHSAAASYYSAPHYRSHIVSILDQEQRSHIISILGREQHTTQQHHSMHEAGCLHLAAASTLTWQRVARTTRSAPSVARSTSVDATKFHSHSAAECCKNYQRVPQFGCG